MSSRNCNDIRFELSQAQIKLKFQEDLHFSNPNSEEYRDECVRLIRLVGNLQIELTMNSDLPP